MVSSDLLSDPRAAIARRDLASLSREKTIVLALLIQLFVAAFSSFLVVGLTTLYDPSSAGGGEVEIAVAGGERVSLSAAAEAVDNVATTAYAEEEAAMDAFHTGRVDAVLVTDRLPDSRVAVDARVPDGSLRTTLVVVQVQEVLESYERQQRRTRLQHLDSTPLRLPPNADASPYFAFTYTILIPLLLFLPPFISGSVAVDSITEEIERGTLELLRVAPLSLTDVVDGKAAAMALLVPVQVALWIALLAANGIGVSNVAPIVLAVTALGVVVVSVGVGLGLAMGERRSAQLIYSVGVLALFAVAAVLPEHPATTIAKLAVDSPTTTTYAMVGLYVVLAVAAYGAVRRLATHRDVEAL